MIILSQRLQLFITSRRPPRALANWRRKDPWSNLLLSQSRRTSSSTMTLPNKCWSLITWTWTLKCHSHCLLSHQNSKKTSAKMTNLQTATNKLQRMRSTSNLLSRSKRRRVTPATSTLRPLARSTLRSYQRILRISRLRMMPLPLPIALLQEDSVVKMNPLNRPKRGKIREKETILPLQTTNRT